MADASVMLAVRKFSASNTSVRDDDLRARVCVDADCESWGSWGYPDGGLIRLELPAKVSTDKVYFELQERDGGTESFPHTLYYPRMMDISGLQLASAYVLSTFDIQIGNDLLRFGEQVLQDAGQSVILPDSCTWEKITVPGLHIEVTSVGTASKLPYCHLDPECQPPCAPCIWYADPDMQATRVYSRTYDRGGGAVGLSEGTYEIAVKDGEDLVSHRVARIQNGYMTIVRTWPVAP